MARRCLIVSYYFPPTGGGGVQRITKLVKYLSRLGWKIKVVTASEIIPTSPLDESLLKEIPEEIKVVRVKSNIPGGGKHQKISIPNYMQRWVSAFLYIPDSRKKWSSSVLEIVRAEAAAGSYDIVLITSPPFSMALLAEKLQSLLSIPVVLDMRDHWTTYPFKIYPTLYHKYKDKKLERNSIRNIKYGVSAYQSLLTYFSTQLEGFKEENWIHISNGYDEEDFEDIPEYNIDKNYFNLGFLGTFYSHVNNPIFLFKAMALLNKKEPKLGQKLRFHHVGKSMIDLNHLAKKFGVDHQIINHGYLDHKKSLSALQQFDAFLICLDQRKANSGNTIGAKVYEYLRMKKPILTLADPRGEAGTLIKKSDAGAVIPTNNTDKIVNTLRDWINNSPVFSFRNTTDFNREKQALIYSQFMEKIINKDI